MSQTCPNRSQTSYLMIRNTFSTSISHIRVSLKKGAETPLKKIPISSKEKRVFCLRWTSSTKISTRKFILVDLLRFVKDFLAFSRIFLRKGKKNAKTWRLVQYIQKRICCSKFLHSLFAADKRHVFLFSRKLKKGLYR